MFGELESAKKSPLPNLYLPTQDTPFPLFQHPPRTLSRLSRLLMANNQQHQPSVDDFRKYLHPRWLNETDRRDSEVSTASAGTSADQSFWEGHRDSAATVDTVYTRKGSVASKAEGYATVSIEPLQV